MRPPGGRGHDLDELGFCFISHGIRRDDHDLVVYLQRYVQLSIDCFYHLFTDDLRRQSLH